MMGGRIWLESKLGRGSTFHFIACFDKGEPCACKNDNEVSLAASLGEVYLHQSVISRSLSHNNRRNDAEKLRSAEEFPDHVTKNGLASLDGRWSDTIGVFSELEKGKGYFYQNRDKGPEIVTARVDEHQAAGRICTVIEAKIGQSIPLDLMENNNESLLKGLTVLLAEDNLVNQKVACKQLKKFGTQVDVVCDGQQCLKALQMDRNKYDLVLMDVQMPVLDGLQATKIIRADEQEFGYSKKPIIGLTAHAIQGYKDKCLEAGMDAYACKPFQTKQLIEVIQRVLAK